MAKDGIGHWDVGNRSQKGTRQPAVRKESCITIVWMSARKNVILFRFPRSWGCNSSENSLFHPILAHQGRPRFCPSGVGPRCFVRSCGNRGWSKRCHDRVLFGSSKGRHSLAGQARYRPWKHLSQHCARHVRNWQVPHRIKKDAGRGICKKKLHYVSQKRT